MIFKPEMVHLILSGRKTQTRRHKCSYVEGKSYALQPGRGKPAKHRITVEEIRQERLGDISFRDARREGFRTTQEFREYWGQLHKHHIPDEMVYVISFALGDHSDTDRLPAARFGVHGDYVSTSSQALKGVGSEVSEATQARYAAKSEETYADLLGERRRRLQAALREIRIYAVDPKVNRKLREIQRRVGQTGWPVVYSEPDSRTD